MARQRKLPPGMQLRGTVYYSCFRAGGRQVRKRLSTDFDAACKILNHPVSYTHLTLPTNREV